MALQKKIKSGHTQTYQYSMKNTTLSEQF